MSKHNPQNFTVRLGKAYGVLGFTRFLKGYYLLLITQRKRVARIGYHDIYQVKDMKMVPLFKETNQSTNSDEARYADIFRQIKINEGFYFSYTYDLTHTMQENVMKKLLKREKYKSADQRD